MARFESLNVNRLYVRSLVGPAAFLDFPTTGKKFYVHSVTGTDGSGSGETQDKPLATIFGTRGAHSLCTASKGDLIICLPGHVESVIAAAGGAFSKIGVTVIFLGNGANRAKINFGTGAVVATDINFSAAGVTLINPLFVSAIDALTGPIHITAADVSILNGEYRDAAGLAVTHAVVASSAADRLKIDGWKYVVSTTGTQKHSNIQLAGSDHVELKNIEIEGDFNVAPIEGVAACTNIILENIYANNTNVGPLPGLNLHANTTGFAKNVKSRVASGTTYVTSVAKIQWGEDCEGFNTDGYSGEPIGTAVGSGVEGKVDIVKSDLIVTQSDVKTVLSNLVVAKSDIVTTLSNLTVAKSDIVAALSNLAAVKSDLVVIQASEDSDMVVLKSDVVAVQSNLTVLDSASDSDMVIVKSDIAAVKSDLVVLQASEDSDMVVLKSDIVAVQSNLTVLDAASDSDMVVVKSDIAAVKSDLVVIQASEDSDIVILRADLASLMSDLTTFRTKYASDNP